MKCLLIAPLRYPFIDSIVSGLKANGMEIKAVDYQDFFSTRANQRYNNYSALPRKIRNLWEAPYIKKANAEYRRVFDAFKPDLVFIYNNQLVLPELLENFRKSARIAFMLGDNPLYTPTSIYNLHILFQADYVISPDTLWRDQLTRLGVRNVVFDCFGFNSDVYYPMEVPEQDRKTYHSDFIYVGSASKTNWGYKRVLFLNIFKDLDLKAYISGSGLERWYDFFPGVRSKIIPHDRFDAGFNNLVYNCSKIAPVEQVPSLFNGIHVRVFDILGAGILPLCEYSADLAEVFSGIDIPLIKNYAEGVEMARFWLDNEQRRVACVQAMRARVLQRYTPEMVIERMASQVF
ncbi:MAG: glycosyltransferase [Saprospirales bacterium]|nr:glycosyltransferase [Saprospirales bacterium]MBK8921244.1 glycosyltransferase [Saprospirales bacterium]